MCGHPPCTWRYIAKFCTLCLPQRLVHGLESAVYDTEGGLGAGARGQSGGADASAAPDQHEPHLGGGAGHIPRAADSRRCGVSTCRLRLLQRPRIREE